MAVCKRNVEGGNAPTKAIISLSMACVYDASTKRNAFQLKWFPLPPLPSLSIRGLTNMRQLKGRHQSAILQVHSPRDPLEEAKTIGRNSSPMVTNADGRDDPRKIPV